MLMIFVGTRDVLFGLTDFSIFLWWMKYAFSAFENYAFYFSVVDKWYILVDEYHVQVWSRLDYTKRLLVHVWASKPTHRTDLVAVEHVQWLRRWHWWSMGKPGWFGSDQIRRNVTVHGQFIGFVAKQVRNFDISRVPTVLKV